MRFNFKLGDMFLKNKDLFASVVINEEVRINLPYTFYAFDDSGFLIYNLSFVPQKWKVIPLRGLKIKLDGDQLVLVDDSLEYYNYNRKWISDLYKGSSTIISTNISTRDFMPSEFTSIDCQNYFTQNVYIDQKDIISSKNIKLIMRDLEYYNCTLSIRPGNRIFPKRISTEEYVGYIRAEIFDCDDNRIGILNSVATTFDAVNKNLKFFPTFETEMLTDVYFTTEKLGDNYVGCISDKNDKCKNFYDFKPEFKEYNYDNNSGLYPYYYNLENFGNFLEANVISVREFMDLQQKIKTLENVFEASRCGLTKYVKGSPGLPGIPGPRGLQGQKGDSGVPGIGPKGEPGIPGPQGPQGQKGKRGYLGPKGQRGEIGEPGLNGLPGIPGPQGPQGQKGERGYLGPKGQRGEIGEPGLNGLPGIPGPQGPQGQKGETGKTGLIGFPGPKGNQGIPGLSIVGMKGEPGKTGLKGEKGDVGVGLQGHKGDKGEQGPAGLQGKQGHLGPKGLQGPRGWKGEKGERGVDGLQGETGPKGNQGDTGLVGPKGDIGGKGDVGLPGAKGETGNSGPVGTKGDKGEQGIQGLQGLKGERGVDGLQGETGPKGNQGDTGLVGPKGDIGGKGDVGLPGAKGETGNSGPVGTKGDKGEQGIQGLQGLKGERGVDGLQGETGPKGNQGDTGLVGPKGDIGGKGDVGLPGAKGETGNSGPVGTKGDKGEQGIQSPRGFNGTQGIPGSQGLKGDQGNTGIPGPKGDRGKMGLPGPKGEIGPQGPKGEDGIGSELVDKFLLEINKTKIEIQVAQKAAGVAKNASEKSAKEAQEAENKTIELHSEVVKLKNITEIIKKDAEKFASNAQVFKANTEALYNQIKDIFCKPELRDQVCAVPRKKREIGKSNNLPVKSGASRSTSFISKVINYFYPFVVEDEYKVKNKIQELNQVAKIVNAADIVVRFEKVLRETALKCGIANKSLNFDPLKLEKKILSKVLFNDENLNELSKLLRSAAAEACPHYKQTDKFLDTFEDSMKRELKNNKQQIGCINTEKIATENEMPRSFISDIAPPRSLSAINHNIVGYLG
ncbi:collagen-like domain-containing protein [Wolbachia endosymbiont (group A) of Macropis europaea]|uniref:hypothetical protein n=1 Tax=Wolbachia endosymbiont (group A) of Macropis europaea TaxID=2954028 RepID=UPI00222E30EC|nr:hypothetical protein [Wolbachia endosymbiont (group A) of Macropis europaea]